MVDYDRPLGRAPVSIPELEISAGDFIYAAPSGDIAVVKIVGAMRVAEYRNRAGQALDFLPEPTVSSQRRQHLRLLSEPVGGDSGL